MNRPHRLILVVILLITCFGCFFPDGGWRGDRGDYGGHDHGGRGDQEGGRHNERQERD